LKPRGVKSTSWQKIVGVQDVIADATSWCWARGSGPPAGTDPEESGLGFGLAACPALGLLVISHCSSNSVSVFALSSSGAGAGAGAGAGLALVCTLGGATSPAPMRVQVRGASGWMAFTGPTTSRLLLLTDAGHDAVHVIDVVGGVHVGHVAAPGAIAGPRGVAANAICPPYPTPSQIPIVVTTCTLGPWRARAGSGACGISGVCCCPINGVVVHPSDHPRCAQFVRPYNSSSKSANQERERRRGGGGDACVSRTRGCT
jgi:hypothetical protein